MTGPTHRWVGPDGLTRVSTHGIQVESILLPSRLTPTRRMVEGDQGVAEASAEMWQA